MSGDILLVHGCTVTNASRDTVVSDYIYIYTMVVRMHSYTPPHILTCQTSYTIYDVY